MEAEKLQIARNCKNTQFEGFGLPKGEAKREGGSREIFGVD